MLTNVTVDTVVEGKTLPLLIQAANVKNTGEWLAENKDELTRLLHRHGALLFRGFGVLGAEAFEQFIVGASSSDWVEYREAATPRSHISGNVYTATDYHPDHRIYLHNENSHVMTWPGRLFFHCEVPPETGGATPIADCRKVYSGIDPAVRRRFLDEGWRYVRSFGFGLGFPWRKAFGVDTREELSRYCADNFMKADWIDSDKLRITYRRWAALKHPDTEDDTWFNHGLFYNVWNLTGSQKEFVKALGAERMPYNTYYGSGEPIATDVLQHLDEVYQGEQVRFSWQEGDVMMVDNMLAAHGRESYTGQRSVLVGMTGLTNGRPLSHPSTYSLPT